MKEWFFKGAMGRLAVKGIVWLLMFLFVLTVPACSQGKYANAILGSVEHEEQFHGIIIRNERVCLSPASGRVLYHKGEEQRVKKDGKIITIITQQQDDRFYEELKKVTQEIAAYEKENIPGPILKKDLETIDERINKETGSLKTANSSGDAGAADRAAKRLKQLYDKKRELLDKVHAKTPYIEQLYDKKLEMEKTLERSSVNVFSPVSGIVSYCCDGLETVLSRKSLEHLTVDQLMGLKPKDGTKDDHATYGQPLYKIIDDHQWYVVTVKEPDKPPFFDKNQSYMMKIFQLNGKILDTKVYNIIRDKDWEIVIFSIDQQARGYTKVRDIDFGIISNVEGLKLPTESIYNKNGKDYVRLISKDGWDWVEVEVLARDQSQVIIKEGMITLHDRVLINE